MKIGSRVGLLISGLLLAMLAGTTALFLYIENKTLRTEIQNRHLILLRTLHQVAKESLTTKDDILLLNYMKLFRRIEGVKYGILQKSDGTILAHTDTARLGMVQRDAVLAQILSDGALSQVSLAGQDGETVLEMGIPFDDNGERVVARVGFSKKYIDREVNAVIKSHRDRIFMISILALGLGFLLSWALARTLVGPIKRLAEAVDAVGKGKLDYAVPVESEDELGRLARDFNRMAERLRELDQLKTDFVSNVTHELRSPLHSTRLYLGLFFKGAAGELNPKQSEYLKVIESNTIRLARFIDDLLDLAKVERGKLDVEKRPFTLHVILHDMESMFMPHAAQKQIKFTLINGKELPKVMGDAERTRQVLVNILSNAFKFTPEKGSISISAALQRKEVQISVKDTGMGIPSDQLEKIFDKFEQVKGVRGKMMGQLKGTGLGLAIVKHLVEAQGGKIWVESKLKEGSRFVFTLPTAN